jgi:uncharacterized protein
MAEKEEPLPPCMIFVAKDGKWYHEGAEIIHRPIFLWLIQSLEKDEEGNYIVNLNNQRCILEVEDTPLVVQQVDRGSTGQTEPDQLLLVLNDESSEPLDPATLRISPENVLYCTVKAAGFPARFLRPAYYQIAESIEEDDQGRFVLRINDRIYPIRPIEMDR